MIARADAIMRSIHMTGNKMYNTLVYIECQGVPLMGTHVNTTGGGEIEISFQSQIPEDLHKYLKRNGFVQGGNPMDAYSYVYRPR